MSSDTPSEISAILTANSRMTGNPEVINGPEVRSEEMRGSFSNLVSGQ